MFVVRTFTDVATHMFYYGCLFLCQLYAIRDKSSVRYVRVCDFNIIKSGPLCVKHTANIQIGSRITGFFSMPSLLAMM